MHSAKTNAAAEARGVSETDQLDGKVDRENSLTQLDQCKPVAADAARVWKRSLADQFSCVSVDWIVFDPRARSRVAQKAKEPARRLMSSQDTKRAAPAGTERDPQVIDRLVGAIDTSPSTSGKTAATTTAHHDREWWRLEARRVGSDWPSILKTYAVAVRGWRILHDVDQDEQPSACLSADHLLCISSTIETIMCAVRARGVPALKEPANIERLSRCDAAARKEINRRIESLIAAREIVA